VREKKTESLGGEEKPKMAGKKEARGGRGGKTLAAQQKKR